MFRFEVAGSWCWALAAALLLGGSFAGRAGADGLQLIENGASEYRIAVAAEHEPSVKRAAWRLRRDVERASGVLLPIVTLDAVGSVDDQSKLIVLGQNDYTASVGVDAAAIPHDGYALKTVGQNLIIAGNDGPDEPIMDRMYGSAGTYIGVGRFMAQHLGIVQYLPGDRWQHVPALDFVEVPELDEVSGPYFKNRQISVGYVIIGDEDRKRAMERRREMLRWARLAGAGSGELGLAAHEVDDIMRPYVQDGKYVGKPEWVALYNGQRMIPRSAWHLQSWYRFHLCTAHPEVRDITMDYLRRFFAENPHFHIAGISMTDGDRYCQGEICRAQDAPGVTDSITDRYMNFAIDIANRAAEEFPGKQVGFFIYASYVDPPVLEKNRQIPENLKLYFVRNGTYYFDEELRLETHRKMREWASITPEITFYSWPASHGFLGLPLSDPQWLVDNIGVMAEQGYQGYRHLVLGSIHARQPESYLWGQLVYDPDADVDALLDRFYDDLYGDAASIVRAYHEKLASHVRRVNETMILEKDQGDDAVSKYEDRVVAYYAPVMEELLELLDAARTAVKGDAVRSARTQVLWNQLRVARLMVEAIQLGRKIDAGQADRHEVKRLDVVRRHFHEHLIKHGNSDVMDIRDLTEVPRYGRDDLMRYLLIPQDYNKWFETPIDERPRSKWQDLSFRYVEPEAALAGDVIVSAPTTWSFRLDPEDVGQRESWHEQSPDGGWSSLRIDQAWHQQGVASRAAGWYSTEMTLPRRQRGVSRMWLLFQAVDGQAEVWIDGVKVGSQRGPTIQMWNRPWALDVTDHVDWGKTHRVTVRVKKYDTQGQVGIWKPIELRGQRGD
ncbi:MAG: DUF4838 domain-containing protein [Planctomycetota bacterium]